MSLLTNVVARNEQQLVVVSFLLGAALLLVSWIPDVWQFLSAGADGVKSASLSESDLRKWVSEHWQEKARDAANFLFSGSALIAVVLAYLRQSGTHLDNFRVRFLFRRHTIICGMSMRAKILAEDIARGGGSVVIINIDERPDEIEDERAKGICILQGDARSPGILSSAGLLRAANLVCMTDQDETNVAILESARTIIEAAEVSGSAPREFNCYCHITNWHLRNHLEQLIFTQSKTKGMRCRLFNIDETTAAEVLVRFPPERYVPLKMQHDGVHVALLGGDRLAQAMATELALLGHYWRADPNSEAQPRTRLSIVSDDAEYIVQQLRNMCPNVDLLLDLVAIPFDPVDASVLSQLADGKWGPISQYYVALHDEVATLALATLMQAAVTKSGDTAIGRVAAILPPGTLHIDPEVWCKSHLIGVFDAYESCTEAVVIGGAKDRMAMSAHQSYFETAQKNGRAPGSRPAMYPWSDLSEFLRESNRKQVAHIAVKARALGWQICDGTSDDTTEIDDELPIISDEMIEQLAETEHRRWMAFYLIHGWIPSPKFNDSLREHDCLVPYVKLSEEMKGYDRDIVRNMFCLVRSAGYLWKPVIQEAK